MIVYIDNDFKCHFEPSEGLEAHESDFFDGKCKEFIEGYRFVPEGKEWIRNDGMKFNGEMIAPFVDYQKLIPIQARYEADQEEADANLAALIEEVYESDLERIEE